MESAQLMLLFPGQRPVSCLHFVNSRGELEGDAKQLQHFLKPEAIRRELPVPLSQIPSYRPITHPQVSMELTSAVRYRTEGRRTSFRLVPQLQQLMVLIREASLLSLHMLFRDHAAKRRQRLSPTSIQ